MSRTRRIAVSLIALTSLLGSCALAAPKLTAQSIIVNPVPAEISGQIWMDRDPSGTRVPNYWPGEKARFGVRVNKNAYIYIFNVDPAGKVEMIVPNRYTGENTYVQAGAVRTFPSSGEKYTLDIAQPYGVNKVLLIASLKPLNMAEIASFQNTQDVFATMNPTIQGQDKLAQALSIVVNPVADPIPQTSWNADSVLYNVAR